MFGERGSRSVSSPTKSPWKRTSRGRPLGQKAEPTVITVYVPQAYPSGFPLGMGKPPSDQPSELENGEMKGHEDLCI